MELHDLIQRFRQLPASQIAEVLDETLATHHVAVVTAPPGAGKSTLLPLTILANVPADGGRILMLEPRRLAARQIAGRMAEMMGEPVGQTVGYRVRFESKVSAKTRIEVLTEGILTRMLVDDATLEGVHTIVFDEFHERSIHSDLALALTLQSRNILRPDLNIVVMSATIDAQQLCQRLKAPLLESEGRMFPVQVFHTDYDVERRDLAKETALIVLKAFKNHTGDILAFLPGQAEIMQCKEMLQSFADEHNVTLCPLYGQLPPEEQRRAIQPPGEGHRKIVLATPVAETSLTIEGVRVVVDSGYCRALVFDERSSLSHLDTVRISMDMATQRTGRAGRLAEGVCYRLWTLATEHRMTPQRTPEILEADLAPMVLDIMAFGESDLLSLPWLTLPPSGKVNQARRLLHDLGALSESGELTPLGRRMAALPCHPRIARMMLGAETEEQKALACDIAALMEEKDPLAEQSDTDLTLRISMLRRARQTQSLGRWQRIIQVAQEYRKMARVGEHNEPVTATLVGQLVACAYPGRIAKAVDQVGHYRLASGGTVRLDAHDSLSVYDWIAIASLHAERNGTDGRVFLAAPVCPDEVPVVQECENLSWDSKQGCVVMQKERRIGMLVVDARPIHDAAPDKVVGIVCEAVRKEGLSMLDWNDEVRRLQLRIALVAQWHPELDLPDLSTDHLLETASAWLPLYLEQGGRLRTTVAELKKINLAEVLWALVPYDLQQTIDRLAPTHVQVPTGSRIRIDYRPGAEAPVLSVRLQECFGMTATPSVDEGRRPLLMELLSPGFKPVQLTQDLASFWSGTYFEVRKELKRRYPKHYWPENPLEAEAVRGVKRGNR